METIPCKKCGYGVKVKEGWCRECGTYNHIDIPSGPVELYGTAYGYDGCNSPSISLASLPDHLIGKRVKVLVWLDER